MSDIENNGGSSPIDRPKRSRFEDEDWDSDYERDGHDDRHPKRLAVPDPETKAPHFVPSDEKESGSNNNNNNEKSSNNSNNSGGGSRRKKWEESENNEESDDDESREVKVAVSAAQSHSVKQDSIDGEDSAENISIRSLVGTKDAGVIIGRGGKNVSDIRELSSARVTISEIVPGAYERILTVSGSINSVSKAYSLVGEKILSEHTQPEESNANGEQTLSIKLLVPDSKMGTLIGKGGTVIKSIQDASGARLNASEDPLPMSTERTVTIQGTPSAVQQAVQRIATILTEHSDRASPNVVHYRPTPQMNMNNNNRTGSSVNMSNGHMNTRNSSHAAMGYGSMVPMTGMPMNAPNQFYYQNPAAAASMAASGYGGAPNSRQSDYNMTGMGMGSMGMMGGMTTMNGMNMPGIVASPQPQQIFIPNEMVGCIIGKGGSKINEIRQLSGSHIKIADPHGDANERLVTITGTPESNQMALYLLYSRLESEKNRLGMRQN